MPEIFISYAWNDPDQPAEGSREEIVDRLCEALATRGHTVLRDKGELTYKSDIRNFMERIGAGRYIVAVVSDKYLRSHNCMFEALEMLRHREFSGRVFPIVLPDADVFSDNVTQYSEYWVEKKTALAERLNKLSRGPHVAELIEKERDYEEINLRLQTFIAHIIRLNVLHSQKHLDGDFAELIAAIEEKMKAENPLVSSQTLAPSSEKLPDLQSISIDTLDWSQALRLHFTKEVAYHLFKLRQSVNVFAPKGTGRKRLADDLAYAMQTHPVHIVRVNLHNFIRDYRTFLKDMAAQMQQPYFNDDLSAIIEAGCHKMGKIALLVLENLDAVMEENDKKDTRYNGSFLNLLNGLRNTAYCRLLLLSERPHNEYIVDGVSSWLTVHVMQLPELSDHNIRLETERRLPAPVDPRLRTYIIEQLETQAQQPYRLLDDLLRYLVSNECTKDAARRFILDYRRNH